MSSYGEDGSSAVGTTRIQVHFYEVWINHFHLSEEGDFVRNGKDKQIPETVGEQIIKRTRKGRRKTRTYSESTWRQIKNNQQKHLQI